MQNNGLTKALLLKPFWSNEILNNNKTWEIRSRRTNVRGRIGVIASGTSKIYGECELVDCIPLTKELYDNNFNKHHISCSYEELPENYKKGYIWVIKENSQQLYKEPMAYIHPQGAVIWVNFNKSTIKTEEK